jgi:hypothetical protein
VVLDLFNSSISGACFFASDLDLGADVVSVLIFPTGEASPGSEISIGSNDDLFRVVSSAAGEAVEDDSDDDDEDEDDEDNSLLSDPESDDSGLRVASESVIGVVSEV